MAIKKAGITKLNGSNYRTWAAITRAIIEAKDTWDTIELLGPEAETPIEDIDDRIADRKAADIKVNCIIDTKTRTVIIGYCGPEALSRILYL